MSFTKKFEITKQYLTNNTKRRPGLAIHPSVKFIVAHDTGNFGSTAKNNVDYYQRTNNESQASAHIFVDDKQIIECIPSITTDKPEKAWHVRYNMSKDNELYFVQIKTNNKPNLNVYKNFYIKYKIKYLILVYKDRKGFTLYNIKSEVIKEKEIKEFWKNKK